MRHLSYPCRDNCLSLFRRYRHCYRLAYAVDGIHIHLALARCLRSDLSFAAYCGYFGIAAAITDRGTVRVFQQTLRLIDLIDLRLDCVGLI